ncbi:geranylgeranyl reductase family protein [Streptosporangium becharense]|uniref:Geranylgeranyl reductase family protein n=1 Tax=Streptosporangium becharense TaxID=1816182 RepID=A0A7W9MHS3_9ACTN|nr:NAD(P)/FAD-dependent oxidoreductase [Streptosporangium becharense]MBB2912417.1 geranylgeranyl reductase family protein [Streptosporangium becharense]MBB5820754.1 geranylgeranyl reductase family protein [Streptosporangium becharense]
MDDGWDLVIIGGGPAGSAAALGAKRLRPDARVLLLDRAEFPRDKACGDGIAAHGRDELALLGVPDLVADYRPTHRLSVVSPGGARVSAAVARPNHVVPRKVFDARLVRAARERGVEVRCHRVRELAARDGHVVVDGTVTARAVVAADGANSTVRRLIGLPPSPDRHTAIAVRGYADVPAGDDVQLIAMQRDGWPAYAWSFPVGDGTANVGFGMLLPRLRAVGLPGREVLHGRLAELLPHLPARDLRAHHLPLSPGRPRPGAGRVMLAGDAAGLVNPLTGEGIYYALVSGRLAGEAAVGAPGDPLSAYRRALTKALGRHLRTTDVLARAAQSPRFIDAAIATAARRKDVFDLLVEVGLGAGTVPLPLAGAVVRRWFLNAVRGGRF